jgi:hypothetical protein
MVGSSMTLLDTPLTALTAAAAAAAAMLQAAHSVKTLPVPRLLLGRDSSWSAGRTQQVLLLIMPVMLPWLQLHKPQTAATAAAAALKAAVTSAPNSSCYYFPATNCSSLVLLWLLLWPQ